MSKPINVRQNTIRLLEENVGKTLSCSNIFLGHSPKAKEIKAKISKSDLIKLKSFCLAKETINKKITYLGEKISKQCNQQGVNIQTIQIPHYNSITKTNKKQKNMQKT